MRNLTWAFAAVLAVSLCDRSRVALYAGMIFAFLGLFLAHPMTAPVPWLFQTSLLLGAPLLVERSILPWRRWQQHARSRSDEMRDALASHAGAFETLQEQNRQRETQTDTLQQLYTITKAATPALRTGELIATITDAFARFCDFRRLRFLQVDEAPERGAYITAVYEGRPAADGLEPQAAPCRWIDGAILRRYLASREPAIVNSAELSGRADDALQGSIGWAPLMVESQWAGLLVIEGIDPAAFDRLLIVAHQASLQLARVQLYQRLETLSVTDGLTNLFVRRHATQRMREELMRAQRLGWSAALLMLDLDHFKAQNDQYGHLVGDAVLREIAQRLRAQVRQIDILGRWGGEEFVVLLVDTDADEAGRVADRIRASVAGSPIRAYDEAVTQTLSIGIACFPTHGAELAVLTKHADEALYHAKTRGRNGTVFYGS